MFALLALLTLPLPQAEAAAPLTEADRARIEEALPRKPFVRPLKPRRLLIFTRNVGYPGHPSIAHANQAFTRMGQKTGAFEAVVSDDPEMFRPETLRRFDAVFFNNTVGNCFTNAELRQSLLEFVTGGGGLLGVHGTSVAFTRWPGAIEDWPEFGLMIGARGAAHKESNERVWIRVEDPDHPLARALGGKDFEYQDEFFRFGDPFSRLRVRVLLSMDIPRTEAAGGKPREGNFRADNDFALAWVRHYGRGRIFYSTIGHNPAVFHDARMLRFYLAAIQFALGDLPAPTTPSARLSPAVRAQEQLGWRPGIEAYTFHKFTFFETIEKTAQLGLPYVGGLSFQKVSADLPTNFEPTLSDDELRQIRLKLESAGLRLLTYYIHDIPNDPAACRRIFEFGRKMGIETFMTEPKPEALDLIEKFADEYGINVALHNHDPKASPHYWNPEGILRVCQGRSPRLGACGDLGYWVRAGVDPVQAVRTLKHRLITVQVHDLDRRDANGADVPWGTGQSRLEDFFRELRRQKIRPTMIGFEYSRDWYESLPKVAQCIEFFNATTLKLAR
ncbi:MAG: ThuA domain-containing protein [Verrucomicrobiales bacterium]|nr:ThuA domain-containing protein [Verrucomicrobiales bacterium]